MKRRNFLKAAGVIGAAYGLAHVDKWIQLPDSGMWVDMGQGMHLFRRPQEAASTILLRNIGGVDDRRIVLTTSQFGRALPASISGWSKIRLALRLSMNGSASITSTPRLAMGFCSGSANMFQDSTSLNWLGYLQTSATLTFTAVSAPNMALYSGLFQQGTRIGSTITSSVNSTFNIGADPTVTTRRMVFVDITKGSPTYAIAPFFCNATTAAPDVLLADFLATAPLSSPSFTNHSTGGGGTSTFSESVNALTHCNVSWDRTTQTVEICDIAIVKLA